MNSVTGCSKKDEVTSAVRNTLFKVGMCVNAQSSNDIIEQIDVGKAPGPDGLSAEAIKQEGSRFGYIGLHMGEKRSVTQPL